MAASQNFARLREQTMGSVEDEEAVTVNTRALIDKVLARYSGEWTTLRELIQNAADAQAKKVTIRFETVPSASVALPSSQEPSEHLKHTLLHHTLKTLIVSNDGDLFQETDWQRLKRIAEGNPDETKIGAFGVGFYSVFADCESPFVSSGNQTMAFYWKKDSLFTRRGRLAEDQATKGTAFLLDYRNSSTPVPQLLSICQFLATSLTFVGLESIELYLDDWQLLKLNKKMAPAASVKIPSEVNCKTKDGLMKITDVEYQNAQIDATWMNVVGWNRLSHTPSLNNAQSQIDLSGSSLRSWFGRLTNATNGNPATRKAQKEEDAMQSAIIEDLAGLSRASVFLRISTVNVQTNIGRQLAQELERATKKPPPKRTRIAILTSSYDEITASSSAVFGSSAKRAEDIFASVLPKKTGKIFIGFPTAQTTGLLAHISAPSVIPTVERENIDLNARYVRDWNIEMLRVAGIACRIAYTGEMTELKLKLDRIVNSNGSNKITKDDVAKVMPSAVHTCQQYNYAESTPSSKVGQYIEEAFWTCNQKPSIEILSTRGILASQKVRVATEDLSFVEGIPVIPDDLMEEANGFLTKLRDYGLLSDITTQDIKRELEAQALSETQVLELVKWACGKVGKQEMDAGVVQSLFNGTVGSIGEEHIATSSSPVLQLGEITSFVNVSKISPEMPIPAQTIPYRFTKGLTPAQLQSIGWEELQIVPWLRWVVETDGRGFGVGQSLTTTPAVALKVLPTVSKGWDALSQSSKQTVTELLKPRSVIPTKQGMRVPPQAYFSDVKLFDDLPTISKNLQGVKEKFLATLGVRKTIELNVVFDRLMVKSSNSSATDPGKWSHIDLIKYLISVKDDIPAEDIKRLKQTPICPAAAKPGGTADNTKLYKVSELFEPGEAIEKLGLPILQWPTVYRATSPEARFLKSLGIKSSPTVADLVTILANASSESDLQRHAFQYWIGNAHALGYANFKPEEIDRAFLPVQPFPGEGSNLVAKPSQCYANPKAAVLRYRILRPDLQPFAALFGVKSDPPIDNCAQRLIKEPPLDERSARELFGYFAGRLNEISPGTQVAVQLGESPIVPIFGKASASKTHSIRFVAPRACFLGDSQTYGDIFDFVDFGPEANSFLLRIGSKHEPNALEITSILTRQPAKLLDSLGAKKYLQLLRTIAEHASTLKKDRALWQQLKHTPCLLAENLVLKTAPTEDERDLDDEHAIKEYSLASAADMVLVDDFGTYRIFQSHLLVAPQEEIVENLYASLETPWLSKLVEDEQRMGSLLQDQTAAQKLQKLLIERCRLFLHDHSLDAIRHDGKWLEQNMSVKATQYLHVTRRLKGYKVSFTEKRSAALHRDSRKDATLYVTPQYDLFEVSRAVMGLLLKRPKQQDILALETILANDLRRLKTKGYNVDRILRQKEYEARIAESERKKREQETRRLAEAEPIKQSTAIATAGKDTVSSQIKSPESPERQLSMPGAFSDSPEQTAGASNRGKRANNLFSSISKHFGLNVNTQAEQQMQRVLSDGPANDIPSPYQAHDPNVGRAGNSGTGNVTSPRDIQSNLQAAIKSSREHTSSAVFSRPQTKDVKETPTYCDSRPGHDLEFAAEVKHGIRLYLARTHPDPRGFAKENHEALAHFVFILSEVAKIFELSPHTINIFNEETSATIAFNSNGSLFCNLRYFIQLHLAGMDSPDGKVEAMAYWWVTLCHELAHNLESDHNSRHAYYTESFVSHYFRRIVWWASQVSAQSQIS